MSVQIYSYTKIVEEGPNGSTLTARLPEGSMELCTLDGLTYVSMPGGTDLPGQHDRITLVPVAVDPTLRETIKAESRACHLINEEVQTKIRAQYSLEDEQYFSRIGVGVALGVYQFQTGEQESLLEYNDFVEGVRQWGREQRTALGL